MDKYVSTSGRKDFHVSEFVMNEQVAQCIQEAISIAIILHESDWSFCSHEIEVILNEYLIELGYVLNGFIHNFGR